MTAGGSWREANGKDARTWESHTRDGKNGGWQGGETKDGEKR